MQNLELYKIIQNLEKLENKEKPLISLYLNTDKRKTDSLQKSLIKVKDFFKDNEKELLKFYKSPEIKEMEEEILDYLKTHWQHLENGSIFFIGGDDDTLEVITIPGNVPNAFYVDFKPNLALFYAFLEKYDRYLVLAIDKREAKVHLFEAGKLFDIDEISNDFWHIFEKRIGKTLHQKDAEGLFARYVNELQEHLLDLKEKLKFERVIVFIPEKLKPILEEKLSSHFKDLISDIVVGNYTKLPKLAFQQKVKELVEEIEKQVNEKELEGALCNFGNSDYKNAVYGLISVLEHLEAGAVYKILISSDFSEDLYKDKDGNLKPADCDTCEKVSDPINEIIIKALEKKAFINVIEDQDKLKEFGGIIAFVRFKL